MERCSCRSQILSQEREFGRFYARDTTDDLPSHLNVVHLFGVSLDGPQPIIVLEYCVGGSLDKLLFQTKVTLSDGHKIRLVRGIAVGMLHLHKNNIVHRDPAARNVLLTASGDLKISNFGMSRILEKDDEGKTNSTIGPVCWMAPDFRKRNRRIECFRLQFQFLSIPPSSSMFSTTIKRSVVEQKTKRTSQSIHENGALPQQIVCHLHLSIDIDLIVILCFEYVCEYYVFLSFLRFILLCLSVFYYICMYTAPSLPYTVGLKYTGAVLDALTNINMYNFFFSSLRGGMCTVGELTYCNVYGQFEWVTPTMDMKTTILQMMNMDTLLSVIYMYRNLYMIHFQHIHYFPNVLMVN